ncbi:MAG TPA: hypothetical protein VM056_07605 [Terriglobales bacterium]|nr:hypothetical protein [Terriglobales bacterium]
MIILACAFLGIGLFVYVFAPIREADLAHGQNKTRLTFLKERKEVIYENLRDLNFEYKAGKFPEADFVKQRADLENEAAVVLAEMEDIEAGRATASAKKPF